MEELLRFFKTADLPTEPVKVGAFVTVTDSAVFVESCRRRHEKGDEQGFLLLEQYKTAIDNLNEQTATDEH